MQFGMYDVCGKNAGGLKEKRLFLLDMDGTIYRENLLFEGTIPFLKAVAQFGGKAMFITNNSSRSAKDYQKKLMEMGIMSSTDDFYSSTQAMARFLQERYPGARVYCMGTTSFVEEMRTLGVHAVTEPDNIDVAVAANDTELTFSKLVDMSRLLLAGKPFIATNPDPWCPASFGAVPDCGGMCEMLYMATGRRPIVIGKPEPTMVMYCIEHSPFSKEETAVVGDRLRTDIAAGVNAGVTSICVLSGETRLEDLSESLIHPDYVYQGIGTLANALSTLHRTR